MKRLLVLPVLFLTLVVGNPAFSAEYLKGLEAADRGDFATALGEWKPLAEQGDVRAQSLLGFIYQKGKGVPQDYKTAIKWYKLAAEQGDVSAQVNLGRMYATGIGTLQEHTRAYMWWNLSALQGNKKARENRDKLEKQMSLPQIETAQRLARECVEKNYKGC